LDELSELPTIEVERQAPGIPSAAVGIAAGSDSPLDSHERSSRKGETAHEPAWTAHYPPTTADATDARAFYLIRTIFPTNGPLPAR
jgi:hypothetical protein